MRWLLAALLLLAAVSAQAYPVYLVGTQSTPASGVSGLYDCSGASSNMSTYLGVTCDGWTWPTDSQFTPSSEPSRAGGAAATWNSPFSFS